MARLKWDADSERLYETGVRNGVLYPKDNAGNYQNGVAWNGITAITESASGAEPNPFYADDKKYINEVSNEDFNATLEAYTYPDEFLPCDGVAIEKLSTDILIDERPWAGINAGHIFDYSANFGDKFIIVFDELQGEPELISLHVALLDSQASEISVVYFENIYKGLNSNDRCIIDLHSDQITLIAGDHNYTQILEGGHEGATVISFQGSLTPSSGIVDGHMRSYETLIVKGPGLSGQPRRGFGLCYRTVLGNDVNGNDHSSKIHIIYNALAAPTEKAYATINDSPEAISFSWELSTTPIKVANFKSTAHIVLDTSKMESTKLDTILDILYGSVTTEPRLPMPEEIIGILKS